MIPPIRRRPVPVECATSPGPPRCCTLSPAAPVPTPRTHPRPHPPAPSRRSPPAPGAEAGPRAVGSRGAAVGRNLAP